MSNPDTSTCVNVSVKAGTMRIGDLEVPVPSGALKIAGGVAFPDNPNNPNGFDQVFVPPTDGTKGVYAQPITVPGGIFGLGIPFPGGLTTITATVEPVANPTVDVFEQSVKMPVRLKIGNPTLGNNCYLGSASNPITLNLDVTQAGTMAPVAGYPGTASYRNVQHTDTTFAVPGASGCGLLGALNWAVNLRANAPSQSGKNSLNTTSDLFVADADMVRSS
ncbi:hypothetical protein [Rhodococcus sp. ACT016]|uniref:hypothetical protein n=1 Tax=Rhodococcus sp. ACT016 TaxID=3134808 RepID=UPI003D2B8633